VPRFFRGINSVRAKPRSATPLKLFSKKGNKMVYKRRRDSGVSFSVRPFKRRRYRIRRRFRGKRAYASTSQWGRPYSFSFRRKRRSLRRYRSLLWKDTASKAHYRSYAHVPAIVTSPTGLGNAGVYFLQALGTQGFGTMNTPGGTQFWSTGGGAQQINEGVAVPAFDSDIVLRGGVARISVMNPETDVPCRVKIFAVWASTSPAASIYVNNNNTNKSLEWDPTVIPDFYRFGRVLFRKEALLPDVNSSMECMYRFKPQKIDQGDFLGSATVPSGSQLWWIVTFAPLIGNLIADNIPIVKSYNLSFSADAV